jgi:hypothetical protein
MERLGWYLHYAFKFAKVPGQTLHHSAITDNHIQILSSAVNPQSGRSDALSDYSQVQQFIWELLNSRSPAATTIDQLTPDRFTFSPMPKGDAMKTGLCIFNNSFKTAGQWENIQTLFVHDVTEVYAADTAIAEHGHFASERAAQGYRNKFKWTGWFPSSLKTATDPLYINPNYTGYSNISGGLISIDSLLRLFSHSGLREFPRTWASFDNWGVVLPSRPGFAFVYLLLDLVHSFDPKGVRDHVSIKYELVNGDSPAHFEIQIHLKNDGLKELSNCYINGTKTNGAPCGNASNALLLLGKDRQAKGGNKIINGTTLQQLAGGKLNFNADYPVIEFNGFLKIKLLAQGLPPP